MTFEEIEKNLNSHILYIYNNPKDSDAIIDYDMTKEIYEHLKLMDKYNNIILVINTNGGNLAAGFKIIQMLQEKFENIKTVVFDKCSSTGTFIALASDEIYLSDKALITPTEPQVYDYKNGDYISSSIIRNYLENKSDLVDKLDPITYGNYLATISYFKTLCYNAFKDTDKSKYICYYMLNEVNSHQMPLTDKDFKRFNVNVSKIPQELSELLEKEYEIIKGYFQTKEDSKEKKKKVSLIRSCKKISCFEKKYDINNKKTEEGYFDIEEENMKKEINGRVKDILGEAVKKDNDSRVYKDAHWDSYNDSYYHDNYNDRYDDYGDNSYYHDSYRDATEEAPKVKKKSK